MYQMRCPNCGGYKAKRAYTFANLLGLLTLGLILIFYRPDQKWECERCGYSFLRPWNDPGEKIS